MPKLKYYDDRGTARFVTFCCYRFGAYSDRCGDRNPFLTANIAARKGSCCPHEKSHSKLWVTNLGRRR